MPLNVRNPGALPNVFARVEEARALLAAAQLPPEVRKVCESLVAFASTQAELNKRLWESKKGVPEPHGETHMGLPGQVDDALGAVGVPSSIDIGDLGQVGNPTGGFAAWDHQHDAEVLDRILAMAFLGYR